MNVPDEALELMARRYCEALEINPDARVPHPIIQGAQIAQWMEMIPIIKSALASYYAINPWVQSPNAQH